MNIKKTVGKSAAWMANKTARWIASGEINKTMAEAGYITITKQMLFLNQLQLTDEEMLVIDKDPLGVANRLHSIVVRFLTIVDDKDMREVIYWLETLIEFFGIYILNSYFSGSYKAFQQSMNRIQNKKLDEIQNVDFPSYPSSTYPSKTMRLICEDGREVTVSSKGVMLLQKQETDFRYRQSDAREELMNVKVSLSDDDVRVVMNYTEWFKKLIRFCMALTKEKHVDIRPVVLYSGMPVSSRISRGDFEETEKKSGEAGVYT